MQNYSVKSCKIATNIVILINFCSYIFKTIIINTESGYSIISYFNYTHQHTWFQYPATTALKAQMSSRASNYMDPFARKMTQFWFTPSSEHLQWPD